MPEASGRAGPAAEQRRLSGADRTMPADAPCHTVGMNVRQPALPILLLALSVVAGCAQMQVRRLATSDGSEVYDLRGRDPARLSAEAALRCPNGYDTLRQAQKSQALESALAPARWWNTGTSYLEDAGSQAQLLVSCKAAPPPAITEGSAK